MIGAAITPFPPSSVEALDASGSGGLVTLYRVGGRTLSVSAPDQWFARLFARHFSGWHISACFSLIGISRDATIKIWSDSPPPPLPAGLVSFDLAFGDRCHTDGEIYFFESCDSVIRVGHESPSLVELWIGDSAIENESHLARLVFSTATAAMRRCGLFELHGGAVVEPSSQTGVLFIGPSGSGKSTLTMQLAAAGWDYLSDDTLLLEANETEVQARALRRVFAIAEPTINFSQIPGIASVATRTAPFDPFKSRFDPQALFPGGFVEACVPRTLFFPVITEAPSTSARKLSQSETMALLLKMCPWSCYDQPVAREHLRVLAQLARQSTAYELLAAKDLLGHHENSATLIASLVEGNQAAGRFASG